MSDRNIPLTTIHGGINRLRTKGAALSDSLYDLLNGYVTEARTVVVRPGTVRRAELTVSDLDAETHGLVAFEGTLHVFAVKETTVPAGFTLHVIQHPSGANSDGSAIRIKKIHFAAPFLGFLYVVAEFETVDTFNELGDVFHFWLNTTGAGNWEADTIYSAGDMIEVDGVGYVATRLGSPYPSWAPRAPRTVGDRIEPTVYNDYYYEVTAASGATPQSGDTEPTFPTEDGATFIEYTEEVPPSVDAGSTPPPTTPTTGSDVFDRYKNLPRFRP